MRAREDPSAPVFAARNPRAALATRMSDRENSLKPENAGTASLPTDTCAAQRFMDIDWSCPWLMPLAERGER
ncbi:MAG: hypothetical protein CBCREVIR_2865 [Candidatus Burkholderia crenata]|nr:MAG: hypothetical protein CBCREVIR_2865 [Candidatus Burkholderia crenata]